MDGMGWILMVVIGGVAGLLASRITNTHRGLTANVLLGVIGALGLNVLLSKLLNLHPGGIFGQLVTATLGAAILIVIFQYLRKNRS